MSEESIVDDIFDDEFDSFIEIEDTINDIIKLLQLYPELYTSLQDDFVKSNIKQFNIKEHTYLSNITKKRFNIKYENINFKQLKYLNDQIRKKVDFILLKQARSKNIISKKQKKHIVMDDEKFQLELEKILDEEKEDGHYIDKSIINKISNFTNEDIEEFESIEKDENNYGEEIDLNDLSIHFNELVMNMSLSEEFFLENFLYKKFGNLHYPVSNKRVLLKLNRSKVKLWRSDKYNIFLKHCIKQIIQNIKKYQPMLPIDFIIEKEVQENYVHKISKYGIQEKQNFIICPYCKSEFKGKLKYKYHWSECNKTDLIKEISVNEFKLHILVVYIKKRLETSILNSKIYSKLSYIEKSKIDRFKKFPMFDVNEKKKIEKMDILNKYDAKTIIDTEELRAVVLGNENIESNKITDDVLHQDRFIREDEESDDSDEDNLPTWFIKLNKLDQKYSCEICGNYSYTGRSSFENHFSNERHVFGLKQVGYTDNDYEIVNGITKIQDLKELIEALDS